MESSNKPNYEGVFEGGHCQLTYKDMSFDKGKVNPSFGATGWIIGSGVNMAGVNADMGSSAEVAGDIGSSSVILSLLSSVANHACHTFDQTNVLVC